MKLFELDNMVCLGERIRKRSWPQGDYICKANFSITLMDQKGEQYFLSLNDVFVSEEWELYKEDNKTAWYIYEYLEQLTKDIKQYHKVKTKKTWEEFSDYINATRGYRIELISTETDLL